MDDEAVADTGSRVLEQRVERGAFGAPTVEHLATILFGKRAPATFLITFGGTPT
jgi:hypothetical protein